MMDVETIRADLLPYVEKLRALHTPEEIRDFLLHEEVKAQQSKATGCAIAVYLFEHTNHVVGVSQNHIYAFTEALGSQSVCSWPVVADTSEAMKQFVYNFDDGFYPELLG
jgi:hypothetical protein